MRNYEHDNAKAVKTEADKRKKKDAAKFAEPTGHFTQQVAPENTGNTLRGGITKVIRRRDAEEKSIYHQRLIQKYYR